MASKDLRFPFYLRLTTNNAYDTNKHVYLPYTIYNSFYYEEDLNYNIITSVIPSDILMVLKHKRVNGSVMNQTMVSKDDLYQFKLNNNDDADVYQFALVFNALVGNRFIYQTLTANEEENNLNVFICGEKQSRLVNEILDEVFLGNEDNEIMEKIGLEVNVFDCERRDMKRCFEEESDATVDSMKEIRKKIEALQKEISKRRGRREEMFVVSAAYGRNCRQRINLILMNENDRGRMMLNAINIMDEGFGYQSVFLLNVKGGEELDSKSIEEIRHWNYLYMNQDDIMKMDEGSQEVKYINVKAKDSVTISIQREKIKKEDTGINEEDEIIFNTLPNHQRYLLDCLSTNRNHKEESVSHRTLSDKEDSREENDTPSIKHDEEDDLHIDSYNEYIEKQQTQSNQSESQSISLPVITMEISHTFLELPSSKETINTLQTELKQSNERIKRLIHDNSLLSNENASLKQYESIESQLNQFEAELGNIQLENQRLIGINQKQAETIEALNKDKRNLNVKYKKSKEQIGLLEQKLNSIEEEFEELTKRYQEVKLNYNNEDVESNTYEDNEEPLYNYRDNANRYSDSNIYINRSMQPKPINLTKRQTNTPMQVPMSMTNDSQFQLQTRQTHTQYQRQRHRNTNNTKH